MSKGEYTIVERQVGTWGSISDDGIPIPQIHYAIYSPMPEYGEIASAHNRTIAEQIVKALNTQPDLYEALKLIKSWAEDDRPVDGAVKFIVDKAEKALAKAEGKDG